jgi:hypothetical protein
VQILSAFLADAREECSTTAGPARFSPSCSLAAQLEVLEDFATLLFFLDPRRPSPLRAFASAGHASPSRAAAFCFCRPFSIRRFLHLPDFQTTSYFIDVA